MKRLVLLILLGIPWTVALPVGFALLPAQQQEDPHEGQPDTCSNAKNAPKAHLCECKKDPGEDGAGCEIEDIKCKVYCRKNKCFCAHQGCTD